MFQKASSQPTPMFPWIPKFRSKKLNFYKSFKDNLKYLLSENWNLIIPRHFVNIKEKLYNPNKTVVFFKLFAFLYKLLTSSSYICKTYAFLLPFPLVCYFSRTGHCCRILNYHNFLISFWSRFVRSLRKLLLHCSYCRRTV